MSDGDFRCAPGPLNDLMKDVCRRISGGVKPGLDVMRNLLECLGNPHQRLAVIHVAGTNGKGSVCALLESLFRHAGLKTGLYTSPHLVLVNERFKINQVDIDDETLGRYLKRVLEADAERMKKDGDRPATFFELGTAAAFQYFADSRVDIVLLETGMGGRWDATNLVIPMLSVITNIEFDHVHFLGSTIESIAAEKCGIIKKGHPVVIGALRPEARAVLNRQAAELGAPVLEAPQQMSILRERETEKGQQLHVESTNMTYGRVTLPLRGDHQISNLAVALTAFEEVAELIRLPYDEKTVRAAILNTRWPGRFQQISDHPVTIVDGAHNVAGVESLVAALRHHNVGNVGLVCGFLADKDTRTMAKMLASVATRCWTVPVHCPRSMTAAEAASLFRACSVDTEPCDTALQALERARNWALAENRAVVAAGSLYLIGEILADMNHDK